MGKTWIVTAMVVAVIAGTSYGLYEFLRPEGLPEQMLYGNGHIEGTEIRVAAEVSGQVVAEHIAEGQSVSKGDVLFEIDGTELTLERQRLEAEIEALRREQQRAESGLQTATHHLATAREDLDRYRALRKKGAVTPQRVNQAENAFEEAQGQMETLKAEIAAIGAKIKAAKRQLDTIDYRLTKTEIGAPADSTVLVKALEEGEFVQPGQTTAVLMNLSEVELRVFIPESSLAKIKLGDPARIRVDAFPDRFFQGKVARVEQRAQFTPRDIHMPEERVRTVFGVILSIVNPGGSLKPGMPADAWILWDPEAEWPESLHVPG